MKPLLRVMLVIAGVFATLFILGRFLGVLTIDNVRIWLEWASTVDPMVLAGIVIALLFIDLFLAVPTLSITLLAGFFLGFPSGFVAAMIGVSAAAITAYCLSRKWGERGINLLVKNDAEKAELTQTFHKHGPIMILLARAAPMLPEVTACLAGATRMPFRNYAMFFLFGTVPYVSIATYAGSVSDLNNPTPAILATLFLYGVSWTGWFVFRKKNGTRQVATAN